jgi:hypothetical protein
VVAFLPLTLSLLFAAVIVGVSRTPQFWTSIGLFVAAVVGAYPRPDVAHLSFVLPLATPMFALALTALIEKIDRRAYRAAVMATFLAA